MFDFQTGFGFASAAAIAGLATFIVAGKRRVRTSAGLFPFFLGVWSLSIALANLTQVLTDPGQLILTLQLLNVLLLVVAIYCVHAVLALGKSKPTIWPGVIAAAWCTLVVGGILIRPESFVVLKLGRPQVSAGVGFTLGTFYGAFAIAAFTLCLRRAREPSDLTRRQMETMLAAFLLYLPYTLLEAGAQGLKRTLASGLEWNQSPILLLFCIASGALVVGGLIVLVKEWLLARDASEKSRLGFLLSLAGISIGLGAIAAWAVMSGAAPNGLRLQGPLRLIAAAIIAYAIVRHHIFGIDLKIKWTLDKGALLGIFGGVFFVVDQAAQFFVSDAYGALAGAVAALLLILALAPLRKLTHRLADRAMPSVQNSEDYFATRRATIYRAAARSAARDGTIKPGERSVLEALVKELGMGEEEARSIERDAMAG